MKSNTIPLLPYLAAATALSGGFAQGAVIFKSFELKLDDTDLTSLNPVATLAVIRFDGTDITLDHVAGTGISISADDIYTTTAKVTQQGVRQANGYLQTASLLNAGDVLAPGFAAAADGVGLPLVEVTSNQYLGVSTPAGQLGWIRYSTTGVDTDVTIHDVAFESVAGRPITVGAVPEPSSLGLVGLAGGLAFLRRRRNAA